MSRHDEARLQDIIEAVDAIQSHLSRGDLRDGMVYDAVRVRLIEIGEAVKAIVVRRDATLTEQLRAQTAQLAAEQSRMMLTDMRFKHGAASSFEVLDAQRSLFAAQQAVVQVQTLQVQNLVTLYKVLGGGWTEGSAQKSE